MTKTDQFQVIQFCISMQYSSIWPIDRTLSGAITLSQSGPGSNGNEGVLCIHQSSSNIGTSPSDCLVSYAGHSLRSLTLLQRCSQCILQYQPTDPGNSRVNRMKDMIAEYQKQKFLWAGHIAMFTDSRWIHTVLECYPRDQKWPLVRHPRW